MSNQVGSQLLSVYNFWTHSIFGNARVDQTSAHKEFINAAKEGELRAVQVLLNAGALEDVNCQDVVGLSVCNVLECTFLPCVIASISSFSVQNGYTALHWASWEGHTEIVRVLLACPGVNVNKQSEVRLQKIGMWPIIHVLFVMLMVRIDAKHSTSVCISTRAHWNCAAVVGLSRCRCWFAECGQ